MSPDSVELEEFFAPHDSPGSLSHHDLHGMEGLGDYARFFEKLATLDDMPWYMDDADEQGETGSAEGPTLAKGRSKPNKKPAGRRGRATAPKKKIISGGEKLAGQLQPETHARPAIRRTGAALYHSHEIKLPAPELVINLSQTAAANRDSPWPRAMARLRMATLIGGMCSVLFLLGLGVGGLVLSLPEKSLPSPDPVAPVVQTESTAAGGSAADLRQDPAKTDPESGKETHIAAENSAPGQQEATVQKDAGLDQIDLPIYSSGSSEPKHTGAKPGSTADGKRQIGHRGDYALQVGACSSYACVEAYRELLAGHVKPQSIRVLTANRAQGGAIQRIRVEPLRREEADRLKTTLAAVDSRFAKAYLISLQ